MTDAENNAVNTNIADKKDEKIRIEIIPQDDEPGAGASRVFYEEKQISLYEIAEKYWDGPDGSEPVFAIVNGIGRDLSFVLTRSCTVKLLDLRARLARLIYQRSIFFLFLIALNDVMPGARVSLKYPLNGGLFVKMKTPADTKSAVGLVWQIEYRMKEIVAENRKFTKRIVRHADILAAVNAIEDITTIEKALKDPTIVQEHYGDAGREYIETVKNLTYEQIEFLRSCEVQEIFEYTCGDFTAVFYDPLLESSGQLKIFDLVPYEGNLMIRVPHAESPQKLLDYRNDKNLYKALRDVSRWQSYVNVRTISDLNRKLQNGEWHEFVLINEAMHEKKIAMIADEIVKKKKRIILIAGPSSSGKTTFAQRLCIQLRVNGMRPLYMGTDDYFVERG